MNIESLLKQFPKALRDRTRVQYGKKSDLGKGPILYWMRNAARGHENPALNAMIHLANETSRPPFVMHAITSVYPYASDRHHTFQLQGAIDVDRELNELNVPHGLYVETNDNSGRVLKELIDDACLLIVEEIPVKPFSIWGKTIAESTETPAISVDTDCIVPMKWPDQFCDRAYKFRNATENERDDRLGHDWSTPNLNNPVNQPKNLPFDPVDPAPESIPRIVASCNIDHGIGPVGHSNGGAKSGYDRWETFRQEKLDDYHNQRNTPSEPEAVSRLSPYLHYGQISPFGIAREASEHDSRGADKFIDELITWRELAHHYCFHHANYNCFNALPDWSQKTLQEHADDPRDTTYDWLTLARGQTGDKLWDLFQRSLLTHGELHNNVRMTWAKQLLHWTDHPKEALNMAIDLNNRYALDGRDPNSYGGILWCFGLFDKPYDTDRPVIGQLRPRTTDWHQQRIDLDSFSNYVHRPLTDESFRVAVIGAGIAGSTATRILVNHGVTVDCYEKSRGSGGRSSTRRRTENETTFHFDHGAQYCTVRSMSFRRFIQSLVDRGDAARWNPELVEIKDGKVGRKTQQPDRYVTNPGMSALTNYLLDDIEPAYGTKIEALEPRSDQLELQADGDSIGRYDTVILTAPPKQSAALAESVSDQVTKSCRSVEFLPTWAVMLGFDRRVPLEYDAAFVNQGHLDWMARNSSKPGRPDAESWVLHASPDWSAQHVEDDSSSITEALIEEFTHLTDLDDLEDPVYQSAHRWLYARADEPLNRQSVIDRDAGLVLAGDWLAGSRVEGALLSGRSAASRVLNELLEYR
ncbi:MAG: FAD-dependent oxidoreductase [bacterium]